MVQKNAIKYFIGYNDNNEFKPTYIYKASTNDWIC